MKANIITIVFGLGLILIPFIDYAQGTIKGKVFEPESHDSHDHNPGQHQGEVEYLPLPGANVIWKGTRLGTMTDIHGYFKLPAANIGDTLQISMIGFETVGLVYTGQKYVEIPLIAGVAIGAAEITTRLSTTTISLLDPLNVQQLNRKELAKAACCNLSEAFETNASVDASFTDAVTGTRQIRMLGLDGKYTQILVDNLPGPRGLNVVQGLSFIPGPWIDQIAISKGTGSVTGGYESITGQINVAMRNPENAEPIHVNIYRSADGRLEWNHVSSHQVGRRWSTALLTHAELGDNLNDRNYDGFLDTPLKKDFVVRNEWKYRGDKGLRGEYSLSGVSLERLAGQMSAYEGIENAWDLIPGLLSNTEPGGSWTAATTINRYEASAKTGYVFPGEEWKSFGSQFFTSTHEQNHQFGNRRYTGKEKFFRGNILFSNIIGSTNHKFTTGLSFVYDDFEEVGTWAAESNAWILGNDTLSRTEIVPGSFLEYTWTANERLVVVAGLRGDYHNLYGAFASPRLHARYSLAEETSIKLVAGRGFRTANVFMEQLGSWASNRMWDIQGELKPEIATNFGLNLVSKFRLNSRDASVSLDGYWTEFQDKVVVDLFSSPNEIRIYNLSSFFGVEVSRSKTLQLEFDWSLHRRVDMRAAYRWVDAVTYYAELGLNRDPFVSRHRAFTQWSYASRIGDEGEQTRLDATVQWVGSQALPRPSSESSDYDFHPGESPAFTQLNIQLSRNFNAGFELYAGVENLLDVKQENPIVGADYPEEFNDSFDASLVYGPIFGRMSYVGLRWTVGAE